MAAYRREDKNESKIPKIIEAKHIAKQQQRHSLNNRFINIKRENIKNITYSYDNILYYYFRQRNIHHGGHDERHDTAKQDH